jgi:small subunit ribosomal protein S35
MHVELAKPFELPTAATPFRFRYTSYLGEKHPAANKVVVQFAASDMPNLTQIQKNKLIKLAGPRYNPDTDIIKMSCELFDTLPQNKRFLGDTISKLLAEARDGTETFEDVPFDFRHHKPKVRHEFPKEWVLTDERKSYLEAKRQQSLQVDEQKLVSGEIVDGERIVGNALPFMIAEEEPVMVPASKGKQRQLR